MVGHYKSVSKRRDLMLVLRLLKHTSLLPFADVTKRLIHMRFAMCYLFSHTTYLINLFRYLRWSSALFEA